MDSQYIPKNVEAKWQTSWEENKAFQVSEDQDKEKYYLLEMFPYPPVVFIWAMFVIMPLVMLLLVLSVCKGSTFFIPWDGTLSECLLKMPQLNTKPPGKMDL